MNGIDTALSMICSSIDLIELIRSKLESDYCHFTNQLNKIISSICNQMREGLSSSLEFKNAIPENIDQEILETVLSCLKEGIPISPRDLLQDLKDIPNCVRAALSQAIFCGLNESFEFCLRDYAAWIVQDTNDIKKHLLNIDNLLDKISHINNSAEQHNNLPTIRNRFHYTANTVEFLGRTDEISKLMEFCGVGGERTNNSKFSWWVITGAGGTGKSRLCHEFSKKIEKLGWQICVPANHDFEKLTACSNLLTSNTLFILDYAENNISSIGKWMETLSEEKNTNILIRVILIQRCGRSFEDIKRGLGSETKSVLSLESYVYNNGNFLLLESPKESISQIQVSYAKYRGMDLTPEEVEKLYHLLRKVDSKMLRPLYAILIVDAYADDKNKPLNWSRKDALQYICDKEQKLLEERIKSQFGNYQDYRQIVDVGILLKVVSTMISGIDMEKDLELILPSEKEFLMKLSPMQRQLFFSIKELFSEEYNFCYPLEPDIIGEFFVIKFFRENQYMKNYIREAWKLPKRMKLFVSRVKQDHPADFRFFSNYFQCVSIATPLIERCGFEFSDNITEVTICDTVKHIESCAFRGCRALSRVKIQGNLSISNSCFSNCQSLSQILFIGKIQSIGTNAFSRCTSITKVRIKNSRIFLSRTR